MGGGVTVDRLDKMKKSKFIFMLKRMRQQIKEENDRLKTQSSSSSQPATGKMKLLGLR